ncbi:ABC transporter permease [Candidatus Binatia bacterium]|nr:ABC transporter permease [Candidatus Binatia bacterium]
MSAVARPPGFWSNVAAVAYKEASVLRHDRALLVMVFAQPLIMLLLFGLALSTKPRNVPWVVLDRSNTVLSRRLIQEVDASGYFLPGARVGSYEEGLARLQRGAAAAFVVIPADFRRAVERERPRVQAMVDGSDPLTAARVSGYLVQLARGLDTSARPAVRDVTAPPGRDEPIDVRQRFWFNPTLRDREFFLAAIAGILLTNLCLSVMSLGLVAERELGTFEQTLSLPTTPIQIVLGKLVPYGVVAYFVLFFATAMAGLLFGVWPRGSWLDLAIVTLPFVLASLGLGVFVSAVVRTSAQAVFISVFFILPSIVLSGVVLPYQLMPAGIRELGGIFPLRWYQIALRRVVTRGAGLGDVWEPMLVLGVMFAVVLLAIRWRLKARLD